MLTRFSLPLCLASLPLLVAGCNGPQTSAGNREAAHERMNAVAAHVGFEQARQALEIGQLDRALAEIDKTIARNDTMADYHVLRGRILLEKQHLEAALAAFDEAIERDAANASAHYYSGIVYQRWSNDELAHERYLEAFERNASNVHYLLAAAEALIALKRPSDARDLVAPRLDYFEHNAALRHLLAQVELLEGRPAEAVKLLREARFLRSDDEALLEELAAAQFAAGQFGPCLDSIAELERQLDLGKRRDLLRTRARCLAELERLAEAREIYATLTRTQPTDVEAWAEYGMVAWELGDYRRVGESSTRVMNLAPRRHEGYLLRGVLERESGRADEAVEMFRKAAALAEGETAPYVMLGITLFEIGDKAGARAACQEALRMDPDDAAARAVLTGLARLSAADAGTQ